MKRIGRVVGLVVLALIGYDRVVWDRHLPQGPLMTTPEVAGFDQAPFIHQGRTHPVYRAGAGPAVIVVHEIPGIHPGMVAFAQRLLVAGYTVYLPSLFGRAGQPASNGAGCACSGCGSPPIGAARPSGSSGCAASWATALRPSRSTPRPPTPTASPAGRMRC